MAGGTGATADQVCGIIASDVESLARRLAGCAVLMEEVCRQARAIGETDWESPAGRRFRDHLAGRIAALLRISEVVQEAAAVTWEHAQAMESARLHQQAGDGS